MPNIAIIMPQEENEGTAASIGQWLKKAGDAVEEHQPLLEINTDKVTIEVPAPASGMLSDQLKAAGDSVLPGDLLGHITTHESPLQHAPAGNRETIAASPNFIMQTGGTSGDDTYSPAVRRLLQQHHLDPQTIPKLGRGGRLTLEAVEAFLLASTAMPNGNLPKQVGRNQTSTSRMVPHTPMRKSIATHMARSVQTAPHVTAVFEADLSQVLADRTRRKAVDPEAVPSVTAYLIHAAVKAIRLVPEVNSKWHDDALEIFDAIHFGVGTALDKGGLVVPVIRDAHTMDLPSISENLRDLTAKARAGKLTLADMQGGTFTLSNYGVSGSLLAAPIILPDDQAAILGAGKMQKRVIVCESDGRELFRIRPMMYVTLTVDHRALDAQQTNAFLSAFVAALEEAKR